MTATESEDSGPETTTEEVPVEDLSIHPQNERVYWPKKDGSEDGEEEVAVEDWATREIRGDDFSGIKNTMDTHGLENPIKVDQNNQILSGVRRWKAAKELGWETIPAERIKVADDEEALRIILLDNTTRKEWPPLVRYREAKAFYSLYDDGDFSKGDLAGLAGVDDPDEWEPQALVAEAVGWSHSTYLNVAYVVEEDRAEKKISQSLGDSEISEEQADELQERLKQVRRQLAQNETSAYGAWNSISSALDEAQRDHQRSNEEKKQEEAEEVWETTKRRGDQFAELLGELHEDGHLEHLDEVGLDEVRDQVEVAAAKIAAALDELEQELEDIQ